MPFLFIPPLVLILPPLIWGWLTYRSSATTCWPSTHPLKNASRCAVSIAGRCWALACAAATWAQRRPSIFSLNAAALFLAPFLILVSVWLYTWVFCFCHGLVCPLHVGGVGAQRGTAELVIE